MKAMYCVWLILYVLLWMGFLAAVGWWLDRKIERMRGSAPYCERRRK